MNDSVMSSSIDQESFSKTSSGTFNSKGTSPRLVRSYSNSVENLVLKYNKLNLNQKDNFLLHLAENLNDRDIRKFKAYCEYRYRRMDILGSLPVNIVVDIFSLLPQTDIFRLRCISKTWKDLLTSDDVLTMLAFSICPSRMANYTEWRHIIPAGRLFELESKRMHLIRSKMFSLTVFIDLRQLPTENNPADFCNGMFAIQYLLIDDQQRLLKSLVSILDLGRPRYTWPPKTGDSAIQFHIPNTNEVSISRTVTLPHRMTMCGIKTSKKWTIGASNMGYLVLMHNFKDIDHCIRIENGNIGALGVGDNHSAYIGGEVLHIYTNEPFQRIKSLDICSILYGDGQISAMEQRAHIMFHSDGHKMYIVSKGYIVIDLEQKEATDFQEDWKIRSTQVRELSGRVFAMSQDFAKEVGSKAQTNLIYNTVNGLTYWDFTRTRKDAGDTWYPDLLANFTFSEMKSRRVLVDKESGLTIMRSDNRYYKFVLHGETNKLPVLKRVSVDDLATGERFNRYASRQVWPEDGCIGVLGAGFFRMCVV